MTDEPKSSLVGTTLGNYEIRDLLGKGGMGEVYLAYHPTLDRKMAVKVLSEEVGYRKDLVERFKFEAQAVNRIEHDAIVQVIDFGVLEDGRSYYVMEHLDGESLRDLLKRRGRLPVDEAAAILLPVMDALQEAHESGVVHRDIKPDNIFVARTRKGQRRAKVLDFGIAKLIDTEAEQSMIATQTGMLLGTPVYMSPEQAGGAVHDIGPWSDVYSLGVVLYHILAGKPPFSGTSFGEYLMHHMQTPPPALPRGNTAVPLAVAAVVERSLAKKPADRFQSVRDMHDALASALAAVGTDSTLAAGPGGPPSGDIGTEATMAASATASATAETAAATSESAAATAETAAAEPRSYQTSMSGAAAEKVGVSVGRGDSRWRPPTWSWAALALLVVAAVTAWFWTKRKDKGAEKPAFSPKKYGLSLPRSDSATRLRGEVEVVVSPKGIYLQDRILVGVRNGKVDAKAKRDGPDGFFIDPLFREAKKLMTARKGRRRGRSGMRARWGRRGGYGRAGAQHTVRIAFDGSATYRLMAEVLYTLGQAEFKDFQFVIQKRGGRLGVVHFHTPRLAGLGEGPVLTVGELTRLADGTPVESARTALKAVTRYVEQRPLRLGRVWKTRRRKPPQGSSPGEKAEPAGEYRCSLADLSTRREVSLLLEVNAQGSVIRYASKGSNWELDMCCVRPWVASWRLPAHAQGRYQLTLGIGETPTGTQAAPRVEALQPLLSPEPGCRKPLDLTVVLTQKGASLRSSQGSECPKAAKDSKLCFRTLTQDNLGRHLHSLWSRKYASARWWRNSLNIRGAITVIAENDVRLGRLLRLLDIAREKPSFVKTKTRVPCRYRFDGKQNEWILQAKGAERCMYPFVTLALGSL